MLVPTAPRYYTVAEVLADPLALNRRLGAFTNFVNLLDLAAIAVPSGMRDDGLPSSVTLIGASGTRRPACRRWRRRFRRRRARRWARRASCAGPAPQLAATQGRIEIVVVGAHLTGLPLNRELTELGGRFVREVETTRDYRLYALPGTTPPKPGLLRIADGEGAAIKCEIWSLDAAAFGAFVAKIPPPLGIGTLRLAGGGAAKGFLVEGTATQGAEDISTFGGWRAYLARR